MENTDEDDKVFLEGFLKFFITFAPIVAGNPLLRIIQIFHETGELIIMFRKDLIAQEIS